MQGRSAVLCLAMLLLVTSARAEWSLSGVNVQLFAGLRL